MPLLGHVGYGLLSWSVVLHSALGDPSLPTTLRLPFRLSSRLPFEENDTDEPYHRQVLVVVHSYRQGGRHLTVGKKKRLTTPMVSSLRGSLRVSSNGPEKDYYARYLCEDGRVPSFRGDDRLQDPLGMGGGKGRTENSWVQGPQFRGDP